MRCSTWLPLWGSCHGLKPVTERAIQIPIYQTAQNDNPDDAMLYTIIMTEFGMDSYWQSARKWVHSFCEECKIFYPVAKENRSCKPRFSFLRLSAVAQCIAGEPFPSHPLFASVHRAREDTLDRKCNRGCFSSSRIGSVRLLSMGSMSHLPSFIRRRSWKILLYF